MAQAFDMVMWCFEVLVRDKDKIDLQARFDLRDVAALFVQQEGGDIDGHLRVQGGRAFLHGFFLQQAQDVQGAGFRVADNACAVATRAGDVRTFIKRRTQPLTRQFH